MLTDDNDDDNDDDDNDDDDDAHWWSVWQTSEHGLLASTTCSCHLQYSLSSLNDHHEDGDGDDDGGDGGNGGGTQQNGLLTNCHWCRWLWS